MLFKGCATALITPFTDDGINFEVFKQIIDNQIHCGVQAIIVCGTTGEPSTMTEQEHKSAIAFAVSVVNKRVPVIAGTGSNDTKKAINMSKFAESAGADGLLLVTPYYNKTTENGLVTHFTEIARNVTLPIILYNVPARTGMNILPNTVLKLSKVSNIVAVKEASGNLQQTYDILADCPKYFTVYIGNDEQILPALMLGASGIISVASNVVPALICSICNLYDEGKIKEAQQIFKKVLPFINSLFCETNPIPVKTAMNLIGFDAGNLRLPLVPMQENNLNKLKTELKKLNLISQ